MKTLTDEQLVERTRKRVDTTAYSELVKRYQSHVYSVAYSLVRDWSEAQDMTQEAFLLAYVKLADLRDATRFAPWLRRITFGTCMDWLKTFRPELYRSTGATEDFEFGLSEPLQDDEFLAMAADETASPPSQLLKKELATIVVDAIASLSPKYRIPITMFHMEGLSLVDV